MSDKVAKYSDQSNNQALRKSTTPGPDPLMAITSHVRDRGTDEMAFALEELRRLTRFQRNMTSGEFVKRITGVDRRLLALDFEFQSEEHDIVQLVLFADFVASLTKRALTVSMSSRFLFLLDNPISQFTRSELAEFMALHSSYAKECYRRSRQY